MIYCKIIIIIITLVKAYVLESLNKPGEVR